MTGIYWLASYPKSGNTWVRAVLSNLEAGGGAPASINALGHSGLAQSRRVLDDLLGFDSGDFTQKEIGRLRPQVYAFAVREAKWHKIQKVHDACQRNADGEWIVGAPASAGALYLIRNPLDVAISYAHHGGCSIDDAIRRMADPDHCLAAASETGLKSQVEQRLGSWSEHVVSWVDDAPFGCTVLRYEDMATDPLTAFTKATKALDLNYDEATLALAIDNASFSKLQAQEDRDPFVERDQRSTRFFRKGQAGEWRYVLSDEQIDRIVTPHAKVMRRFGYLDDTGAPRDM